MFFFLHWDSLRPPSYICFTFALVLFLVPLLYVHFFNFLFCYYSYGEFYQFHLNIPTYSTIFTIHVTLKVIIKLSPFSIYRNSSVVTFREFNNYWNTNIIKEHFQILCSRFSSTYLWFWEPSIFVGFQLVSCHEQLRLN